MEATTMNEYCRENFGSDWHSCNKERIYFSYSPEGETMYLFYGDGIVYHASNDESTGHGMSLVEPIYNVRLTLDPIMLGGE